MGYLFEKWNTSTEEWDDISQYVKKPKLSVHMDITDGWQVEYGAASFEIPDSVTIDDGDFLRYREDTGAVNYESIIQDNNSTFTVALGIDWTILPLQYPSFDVNSTVAGKLWWQHNGVLTANRLYFDRPNILSIGITYRVSVKARHRTGETGVLRIGTTNNYVEMVPTGTEQTFEGTFVADDNQLIIESLSDASPYDTEFEIDDLEVFVEAEPMVISGYASEVVHMHKKRRTAFELISEISALKNIDIPVALDGDNIFDRLRDATPDGYVIVEMDSDILAALKLTDTFITGMTAMQYHGDHVVGTDSNVYRCKVSHTAATANKPVTGGSYTTYWEQVTETWSSGQNYGAGHLLVGTDSQVYRCILQHTSAAANQPVSGGSYTTYWALADDVWVSGQEYSAKSLADLIYDVLLILNEYYGGKLFFCTVMNKEIRLHGADLSYGYATTGVTRLIEYEEAATAESVVVDFSGYVFRGTDTVTLSTIRKWNMLKHTIRTVDDSKRLMEAINYSGYPAGHIVGIESDGVKFNYEIYRAESEY